MSTPMNIGAYPVKVTLGDDLRRFSFEGTSFVQLQQAIAQLYNIQGAKFTVRYVDPENDWINISSDRELATAFQFLPSGTTLKFSVTLENAAPLPTPMPVNPPLYSQIEVPNIASPPAMVVSSPTPAFVPGNVKEWRQSWKDHKMMRKQEKLQRKLDKKYNKFERKAQWTQEKALKYTSVRLVVDALSPTLPIPGSEATKIWRLRNESLVAWPEDCMLVFRKGQNLSPLEAVRLTKPIGPGEEVEISIPIRVPSTPGLYMSVWKLVAGPNGKPFGRPFHIKLWVSDPNAPPSPIPSAYSNIEDGHLAQLAAMGFLDRELNERLLRKCDRDLDKVVWKLLKKQAKLQRKLSKLQ